jgi:peptidoglycan-N-acetylglucosamine deacetylase
MRLRRRWLVLGSAAAVAAGAVTLLAGPPLWLIESLTGHDPGCLYRAATRAPLVALTVDDGPDPVTTPLILEELHRHGARATFFLITSRIPGHETIVRRLVAEGHELGNHFTRDRAAIRLGASELSADLERAGRVLASYGPVRWARPGSGWYTGGMVRIMERHGYRCALGSIYPWDAAHSSVAFSTWHILRNVRPGGVIVLHDGGDRGRRTARVLRGVLPELRRRGYRVVTLGELVRRAELAHSGAGAQE